jgi:hypothetical protein
VIHIHRIDVRVTLYVIEIFVVVQFLLRYAIICFANAEIFSGWPLMTPTNFRGLAVTHSISNTRSITAETHESPHVTPANLQDCMLLLRK